jgi:hypothetical protein
MITIFITFEDKEEKQRFEKDYRRMGDDETVDVDVKMAVFCQR